MRRILTSCLFVTLTLGLGGCATIPNQPFPNPENFTTYDCAKLFNGTQKKSTEEQLNQISKLFKSSCYQEVITLGNYVRSQRRDKVYNVTAEVAEVFTPEGTFTEYVLESYERVFLSVLIATSYSDLGKNDDALVELRKAKD
jgi:hypothetical protein